MPLKEPSHHSNGVLASKTRLPQRSKTSKEINWSIENGFCIRNTSLRPGEVPGEKALGINILEQSSVSGSTTFTKMVSELRHSS